MTSKEKKKQYNDKYYAKNKNKILSSLKKKIICECGTKVSKGNLKAHQRSNKHLKLLEKNAQSKLKLILQY